MSNERKPVFLRYDPLEPTQPVGLEEAQDGDVSPLEHGGTGATDADGARTNLGLTEADIKSSYESNPDTNEFSDSEKTKLSGLEDAAELNTASNLDSAGSDAQVFKQKTGSDFELRTLVGQSNLSVTQDGDHIYLAVTQGAGTGLDADRVDGYEAAGLLSADNHTDGSTNKVYTATERTKLAAIEDQAQANRGSNVGLAGSVGQIFREVNSDGDLLFRSLINGNNVTIRQTATHIEFAVEDADILEAFDEVTQAEAEAGTETDVRSWSPLRVAQAIAALGGGGGSSDHGTLTGLGDDDHTIYHTDGRADTWLGTKDSDDLSEGATNLYLTSAERSKLSGIETGATADQTGAEIKSAYESEADTNAYTDAEKTKLAAVEDNADVTDESNVTSALDGASLTAVTVAGTDKVLVQDASDSDNLKTVTAQSIADLASSGATDHGALTGLGDDDHTIYHTDGRADTWLGTKDSDDLSEGATNLYLTSAERSKLSGIETGATADQTGSEILAALAPVDGTGSGLDADKLDGFQATYFTGLISTNSDNITTNADDILALQNSVVSESDTSTADMDFVVDEDDMASDSATKLATQQSIKAYVDGKIDSGTSFPGSPSEGQRFYRTDLDEWFYYDTSRSKWLGDALYAYQGTYFGSRTNAYNNLDSTAVPYSATLGHGAPVGLCIVGASCAVAASSTCTFQCRDDGTSVATISLSAATSNAVNNLNSAVIASGSVISVYVSGTATNGNVVTFYARRTAS